MNLKNIKIDFNEEIRYGEEQMFITYPDRFATVEFELLSTDTLIEETDKIRQETGYKPLSETEGWYNFYIGLNGCSEIKLDACIMAVVVGTGEEDDESSYHISLTEDEQKELYELLDKQCKAHIGHSCEELLQEAEKAM